MYCIQIYISISISNARVAIVESRTAIVTSYTIDCVITTTQTKRMGHRIDVLESFFFYHQAWVHNVGYEMK